MPCHVKDLPQQFGSLSTYHYIFHSFDHAGFFFSTKADIPMWRSQYMWSIKEGIS